MASLLYCALLLFSKTPYTLSDVTNEDSFYHVRQWLQEIDRYGTENVLKILVGNKCDLASKRKVSFDEASKFAESMGMPYMYHKTVALKSNFFSETSAKSSTNVEEAFVQMCRDIKKTRPLPVPIFKPVIVNPPRNKIRRGVLGWFGCPV